jgi:uncharacterized spore protein YtfJ
MKKVTELFGQMNERLDGLVKANAVVAKTISVGDRHVIPLCELGLGFGVGGGQGEAEEAGQGKGSGGGAGGGAKATPVAVIVVDGGKVRIESLGG